MLVAKFAIQTPPAATATLSTMWLMYIPAVGIAFILSATPPARAATISHVVLSLMHSIGFMNP